MHAGEAGTDAGGGPERASRLPDDAGEGMMHGYGAWVWCMGMVHEYGAWV